MKRLILLAIIFFTGLIAYADLLDPADPISPYNPLNPVSPLHHMYFPDDDKAPTNRTVARHNGYKYYDDCIAEHTPAYCRPDRIAIFDHLHDRVGLCLYYGGGNACTKSSVVSTQYKRCIQYAGGNSCRQFKEAK